MTTKTYTRRDSVTSILRKRGITSDQYNDWIIKNDDGTFSVREQAESSTPPWDDAPKTVEVAAPDAEHCHRGCTAETMAVAGDPLLRSSRRPWGEAARDRQHATTACARSPGRARPPARTRQLTS